MLKNFRFLRRNWIYLPSNYFSSYYVYQVYVFVYTKLCKKLNWKNSICIRVNNFAKSVNFTGVFTKKAIEIIKAGTLLLMWECLFYCDIYYSYYYLQLLKNNVWLKGFVNYHKEFIF